MATSCRIAVDLLEGRVFSRRLLVCRRTANLRHLFVEHLVNSRSELVAKDVTCREPVDFRHPSSKIWRRLEIVNAHEVRCRDHDLLKESGNVVLIVTGSVVKIQQSLRIRVCFIQIDVIDLYAIAELIWTILLLWH